MRVYLDNCCFNRPYDDQSQLSISLETQAKIHIQDAIKKGHLELATSFILNYENSQNPYLEKRGKIGEFLSSHSSVHIGNQDFEAKVQPLSAEIKATGVKAKDAYHVASAIVAGCDYFLTTDKRLLRYRTDKIKLLNPIDFVSEMEGDCDV